MRLSLRCALLASALLCAARLASAFTPPSRIQANIAAAAARGEPLVFEDRTCLNDDGSTVWMCISTVLVLGMCPALALFEAGMLRSKSTVSIVSQVFSGVVTLSVMWILIGHKHTAKHTATDRTANGPEATAHSSFSVCSGARLHADIRSEPGWFHWQYGPCAVHRRELH